MDCSRVQASTSDRRGGTTGCRSARNMLVRHYIHRRLYEYYAQPAASVVGSTQHRIHRIPWTRLWGEWHWKRLYAHLYQSTPGQWLTPSELFVPYYSQCLAQYIVSQHYENAKNVAPCGWLHILEWGGGHGTNAHALLDHIQRVAPDVYDTCTYTLVDFSPTLHASRSTLQSQSPHADKLSRHSLDLLDVAHGTRPLFESSNILTNNTTDNPTPCHVVVLGLEVLDNLPHDKIHVDETSTVTQVELVRCTQNSQNEYDEVTRPLSDPLLQRVLHHYPLLLHGRTASMSSSRRWIPTVACGVLEAVARETSRHCTTILVADFDAFPLDEKPNHEMGRPIVTDMDDVDVESYLLRTTTPTDILFPTDFVALALYADRVWANATVQVTRQGEFLQRHGPADAVAATRSWLTGYSPMLDDFANCTVWTATIPPQ